MLAKKSATTDTSSTDVPVSLSPREAAKARYKEQRAKSAGTLQQPKKNNAMSHQGQLDLQIKQKLTGTEGSIIRHLVAFARGSNLFPGMDVTDDLIWDLITDEEYVRLEKSYQAHYEMCHEILLPAAIRLDGGRASPASASPSLKDTIWMEIGQLSYNEHRTPEQDAKLADLKRRMADLA